MGEMLMDMPDDMKDDGQIADKDMLKYLSVDMNCLYRIMMAMVGQLTRAMYNWQNAMECHRVPVMQVRTTFGSGEMTGYHHISKMTAGFSTFQDVMGTRSMKMMRMPCWHDRNMAVNLYWQHGWHKLLDMRAIRQLNPAARHDGAAHGGGG